MTETRRSFGQKADEVVVLLRLMRRRLRLRPHVRRQLSRMAADVEALAMVEQHGPSAILREQPPVAGAQLEIPGADGGE